MARSWSARASHADSSGCAPRPSPPPRTSGASSVTRPAAGARGDVGEQPARPRRQDAEDGGLASRSAWDRVPGVAPGGVAATGRVPGHERVGLGEHHDAEVGTPVGSASVKRPPSGRRDSATTGTRPACAAYVADARPGRRPRGPPPGERRVVGHRQAQAPGRTEPDRGRASASGRSSSTGRRARGRARPARGRRSWPPSWRTSPPTARSRSPVASS